MRSTPWSIWTIVLVILSVLSPWGNARAVDESADSSLPRAATSTAATAPPKRTPVQLPERPNILILMTDQERFPQHWPEGWADANLPNRKRLADTGLSFRRAICNSAMCSPSRSTLFTGLYPAQHGVKSTLSFGGSISNTEPTLPLNMQNLARILASAGYEIVYKGKWHMSKDPNGQKPRPQDVDAYGFSQWDGYEYGGSTDPDEFGGGESDFDQRVVDDAIAYLKSLPPSSGTTRPFALVVSLANPHDVLAYPRTWDNDAVYRATADFNQGIELPPTLDLDNLASKPTAQQQALMLLNAGLGILPTELQRRRYVNFYGFVHKVVDRQIGQVIDALEQRGLRESTVVIRTADHGELGLSHGGLRQKIFNAYEECLRVPLVFSNPILFPTAKVTDSLASLIDLLPTLASLAQVPDRDRWVFRGFDLSPVLKNPAASVQNALLFTFDDQNVGQGDGQTTVKQPNHLRCIRETNWKYARYFDPGGVEPEQYEMYDLLNDPLEVNNLVDNPAFAAKRAELAQKLAMLETDRLAPLPGPHANPAR
ncbi:MAG: sulfatase-like hydrolase/transferase [Acidobacteria bacterium]|nr:sulfatase-like hydrolase/transferase [Acidobacteriota bacterium]